MDPQSQKIHKVQDSGFEQNQSNETTEMTQNKGDKNDNKNLLNSEINEDVSMKKDDVQAKKKDEETQQQSKDQNQMYKIKVQTQFLNNQSSYINSNSQACIQTQQIVNPSTEKGGEQNNQIHQILNKETIVKLLKKNGFNYFNEKLQQDEKSLLPSPWDQPDVYSEQNS
ncbi:unnamed protein product (macronuclear) [Paramecium tetraurelia]|uniref:Uncharacterized protein n=1 Tax=Paramecium tetraurelia TaxID=5888 RepID=A0BF54_PARTE|nr:uncharacterized protein GSPATT00028206001 [Paramecium tetraurelia]CAK57171.1 unnamed protein product [Paramecium tetraurelia]|eukprot:XP_001424569.1 hypothetical protein (macronuclear) [Paramecium tetraurelia strain d4-2]